MKRNKSSETKELNVLRVKPEVTKTTVVSKPNKFSFKKSSLKSEEARNRDNYRMSKGL